MPGLAFIKVLPLSVTTHGPGDQLGCEDMSFDVNSTHAFCEAGGHKFEGFFYSRMDGVPQWRNLDMTKFIPVLIQAIKDLSKEVDLLKVKIR